MYIAIAMSSTPVGFTDVTVLGATAAVTGNQSTATATIRVSVREQARRVQDASSAEHRIGCRGGGHRGVTRKFTAAGCAIQLCWTACVRRQHTKRQFRRNSGAQILADNGTGGCAGGERGTVGPCGRYEGRNDGFDVTNVYVSMFARSIETGRANQVTLQ